jgi:transposase
MARQVDISLEGLHQLLHRIERKELADGDWAVCSSLVLQLILKIQGKQERMAAKFTGASSAVVDVLPAARIDSPALPPGPAAETGAAQAPPSEGLAEKKAKGHGRNGASAFVNAKHIVHGLDSGMVGALCAGCNAGRMTRYREKVVIRIIGQPLFAAEQHHVEQARCRACGKVERAKAPKEIFEGLGSSYVVYDWSACAMLVVMHYFSASPFKRLESLHAGWGVPVPDANLWRMADETDDLLHPLYRALELHGVQKAVSLRIDDTGSMVVALARQIQAELDELKAAGKSTKGVRTGINATGVLLDTAEGQLVLYFTGRHHAGEIIDRMLQCRKPGGQRLVKVTDGASKNFDHQGRGDFIEGVCNAHAFLKFRDIKDKHPVEYAVAGEVYKGVFDNDDEAKTQGLSPHERMLFHREHSQPLMERLKAMCEEKLRGKLVEPNSALWEPLTFIINQLYKFGLSLTPGLDNRA